MSQRLRIRDLPDIIGADSGNEGEKNDDRDLEVDHDGDDTDDGDDDGEEDDEEDDIDTLKAKLEEVTQDRDRIFRRMRRADRAKSKADNELKALQEGGAKELAEARAEIAALKEKLSKVGGTDTTALIREEFRDYDGVKWHNPRLAFELLDLSEVDVDDAGKVDAASLKDAVAKLAKDHPYLVKKADSKEQAEEDEDESGEDGVKRVRNPSGARSLGGRKAREAARRKQIAERYGIRGRV